MRRWWLFYRCRVRGAWLRGVGVLCPPWFRFRRTAIRIRLNDRWHVLSDGSFGGR